MDNSLAQRIVNELTPEQTPVTKVNSVTGGDTSLAYVVETVSTKFFLKSSQNRDLSLEASELRGLQELARCKDIKTPRAYGIFSHKSSNYLLMEYLELSSHDNSSMSLLGRNLAKMHKFCSDKHGFCEDNFIGSNPQLNNEYLSWTEFYVQCRLLPQVQMTKNKEIISATNKLISQIDFFFAGYTPSPSLLHGDLWSGNTASLANGEPVIFDPAVYYGDREADLAMTEMFGGFSKQFYDAYHQEWPIDKGYTHRKKLYLLYHTLNHANLFGGFYIQQAKSLLRDLSNVQ